MTTQSVLFVFGAIAAASFTLWMGRLNRSKSQSSPVMSAE